MNNLEEAQQIATDTLIELSKDDPSWSQFLQVSPALRYYHHKPYRISDWYFWTTDAVYHNGKKRYGSGIYKYLKTQKHRKLIKGKYHAKKKDAKTRAHQLYLEGKGE